MKTKITQLLNNKKLLTTIAGITAIVLVAVISFVISPNLNLGNEGDVVSAPISTPSHIDDEEAIVEKSDTILDYVWYEDDKVKFMYPEGWDVNIESDIRDKRTDRIVVSNKNHSLIIEQAYGRGGEQIIYDTNNPLEFSISDGGTSKVKLLNKKPIIKSLNVSPITIKWPKIVELDHLVIYPSNSIQNQEQAEVYLSYLLDDKYVSKLIFIDNYLLDENPREGIKGNFISYKCNAIQTEQDADTCVEFIEKFFETAERVDLLDNSGQAYQQYSDEYINFDYPTDWTAEVSAGHFTESIKPYNDPYDGLGDIIVNAPTKTNHHGIYKVKISSKDNSITFINDLDNHTYLTEDTITPFEDLQIEVEKQLKETDSNTTNNIYITLKVTNVPFIGGSGYINSLSTTFPANYTIVKINCKKNATSSCKDHLAHIINSMEVVTFDFPEISFTELWENFPIPSSPGVEQVKISEDKKTLIQITKTKEEITLTTENNQITDTILSPNRQYLAYNTGTNSYGDSSNIYILDLINATRLKISSIGWWDSGDPFSTGIYWLKEWIGEDIIRTHESILPAGCGYASYIDFNIASGEIVNRFTERDDTIDCTGVLD